MADWQTHGLGLANLYGLLDQARIWHGYILLLKYSFRKTTHFEFFSVFFSSQLYFFSQKSNFLGFRQNDYYFSWLGLSLNSEKKWYWIDGSEVRYKNWFENEGKNIDEFQCAYVSK